MYFIVDYSDNDFINVIGDSKGSFTFETKVDAEEYAKKELQEDFWQIVKIDIKE